MAAFARPLHAARGPYTALLTLILTTIYSLLPLVPLPMTLFQKVYFPSPPPTSNTLTPIERACLRRSTTKLGRVLGVTPRVLDVDFDATYSQLTLATSHTGTVPRSHQSPTSSPVETRSKGQHASSTFTPRDFHTDECHRSKGTLLVENGESKFGKKTPVHRLPLIRVSRPLGPQHVSKLDHASSGSYYSSESDDSDDDGASAFDTPDNVISLRRKKMERLHRILGKELPVSIVFPESRSDDSGYDSDNGHWQKSAVSEKPSLTVRTPCHSSPPPTPVKSQTEQMPLSVRVAGPPSPLANPRLISTRDPGAITSTILHKVSPKGSSARRSHYRHRASTCDGRMQLGSPIENLVPAGFDVRSLRTISESSKEADGLDKISVVDEARWEKTSTHTREQSLSSLASHSSLRSEWYPSDEETDGGHTDETLVETKDGPTVLNATQGAPKKVWSHKRKPPPAYEL